MTFFDISRKMLKAGFYKYRLYFLCNLSATALFCCFAVISTNRTFMNASIVNSSISNNVYLPFFLSAVFLVFFLPVSCQAFLASRKQEYGVMFAKLAEYKPLAKIEEIEEQNYNMIDDRLNNGVEKFNREEEKKEQAENRRLVFP